MKVEVQQEIIIVLGILGLGALVKDYFTLIDVIVAGLIGFLSQKTVNDKQDEILNELIKKQYEVKEEDEEGA